MGAAVAWEGEGACSFSRFLCCSALFILMAVRTILRASVQGQDQLGRERNTALLVSREGEGERY